MNHALLAAMAEAGETAESLAAQTGVDPKTAGRWITPGRIPQPRRRAQVAQILNKDVGDLWPDVLKRKEPAWFRQWADIEREAISLRWFELAWVPGLLQTEGYARATLAGETLSASTIDQLVSARIERQVVLNRDQAPLFIAVVDELVLRRAPHGDRALMREQCGRLAECATLPSVSVHVVPLSVGMYPGHGGPFILAELPDGGRTAHVDSQAEAQVLNQPDHVATLERRWERIRGEALSRSQSLDLIREAATSWT
ncbi:DUF5753 domain-containing protein [Micromonospora sp. NPDC050397]|uniref:DUF5753 domain-containing protein n=1 Tax=Micromonospora sp. NPDC050397 TaxID=3364279 RepID=UPI0038502F91